jgi:hypothetical protein
MTLARINFFELTVYNRITVEKTIYQKVRALVCVKEDTAVVLKSYWCWGNTVQVQSTCKSTEKEK